MDLAANLKGKVALVTGGGKGIGAAIAERLCALGATVAITGRDLETLHQTAEHISRDEAQCRPFPCDIREWQAVAKLAAEIQQELGRLDILVNNAGIGGSDGPLHKLETQEWDDIFNTNLRGVFYCVKAFAPMLIRSRGGYIINISSLSGKNPLPGGAAYAASKWGLNGLSYSIAEELRKENVRVSVICPGSVVTEFSPHAGKNVNKMLQPADVANVVAMLVTQAPQSFTSEVLIRPTQKP